MVLYTIENCPLCKVAKMKLDAANISYTVSQDEEAMKALNIMQAPVLVKEDGTIMNFNNIVTALQKGELA